MSKDKHTPKWEIHGYVFRNNYRSSPERWVLNIRIQNGKDFCEVEAPTGKECRRRGNLIAASPLLLSVCEKALRFIDVFPVPNVDRSVMIRQLESAINDAKPKGKE